MLGLQFGSVTRSFILLPLFLLRHMVFPLIAPYLVSCMFTLVKFINCRSAGEDSDGDYYRDSSSSDGSSDCEMEKGILPRNLQRYDHPANVVSSRIGRLSMSDEQSSGMEGFSSDDGDTGNSRGCLLFEYLERDPPYSREPLADKVSSSFEYFQS